MVKISSRYDLFIFDWDGTLTSMKLLNALNESLNPVWKRKKTESMNSSVSKKTIKTEETAEEKEFKRYEWLVDGFMLLMSPKLQNGSMKTLQKLRRENKKIAMFSNGSYWRIVSEAKKLKIYRYFDDIVSSQSIGYLKPNPTGINMIIKNMKADPKRCLYIGDMIDDIVAARLAGIDCCAVGSGFEEMNSLKLEKPKYLVKDMEEFCTML